MRISCFTSAKDNQPQDVSINWADLVESLRAPTATDCKLVDCRRSICVHKHGVAWSPAFYAPGKSRGNSNVEGVSCLVLDLDHLTPSELDSTLLKLADFKLVVHASHSDRPDDRCLRVVLALSRVVSRIEWPRFWQGVVDMLNVRVDNAASDCARIYFAPTRPNDACSDAFDGSGYVFEAQDGKTLEVDAILATIEEDEEVEVVYTPPPTFKGAPSPENWEIAVDALSGGWPDAGRNSCQLSLCGALAHAGWPVELIADFVTQVCERAHPGNGDRNKRLKSARYSIEKVSRGEPVTGWPGVIEFIDEEVVGIATRALGIGPQRDDNFVKSFLNVDNKVVVSRDDIELTLKQSKKKLARSPSLSKQKEALYISRALQGNPFSTHSDEDSDKATAEAVAAVTRNAPRGTPAILIAEYLTKSRPDIPVDDLCKMVEAARTAIIEEIKAETPVDADEFKLNQYGAPVAHNLHNYDVALNRLNVKFYYDAFSNRKYIEVTQGEDLFRTVVEDRHINGLAVEIERSFNFFPTLDKFRIYCEHLAHENAFHPVRDYLDTLPVWDKVPRLDSWLIKFGGAEDNPYVRAVSRIILVAAARRVRQPGAKFDEMLILESPQGYGKSTAVKALCPNGDWFSDNFNLEGDAKRMIEQTSGKWIIEAGELRGMTVKDHNALKQYLSSTHDEARMSYARESIRRAREFIIIGTTNDSQYLRDHTGDRRYWPVKVQRFDVEGLLEIREQLWAEAVYLDRANAHDDKYIRLAPELWAAAAVEQSKRKVDNAVKIKLEDYLTGHEGRIRTSDVWKLLTDDHVPQQALVMQASNAMQELGWEKDRFQVNNKRETYYVKGSPDKQLIVTGTLNYGLAVKSVNIDANGNPVLEQVLNKASAN